MKIYEQQDTIPNKTISLTLLTRKLSCCSRIQTYSTVLATWHFPLILRGHYILLQTFNVREHPFYLKGGGGGLWFLSESKIIISLRSAAEFVFPDNLSRHYCFSANFRDWNFFSSKFADRIFFLPKNHSPFKLNGCSLNGLCSVLLTNRIL